MIEGTAGEVVDVVLGATHRHNLLNATNIPVRGGDLARKFWRCLGWTHLTSRTSVLSLQAPIRTRIGSSGDEDHLADELQRE